MATLIIGPSSVGKSKYISMLLSSEVANLQKVFYGADIGTGEVPSNGYIHYNLLHRYVAIPNIPPPNKRS